MLQGYLAYFRALPINDSPEIFGLHDNANISFAQNETFALLGTLVKLQPRVAASGGKSREEVSAFDGYIHRGFYRTVTVTVIVQPVQFI